MILRLQSIVYRGPQQSPFAPSPFSTASPPGRMRILSAPEHREGSPSVTGAGARHPFSGYDTMSRESGTCAQCMWLELFRC